MELVDPGLWSMMGFGLAVIAGGLIMAAISFFSMKETSFEDVVAKQRKKKELEDKERSRLNKQKREFFKKKFEIKKKKGNVENGKVAVVTPAPSLVHEVKVVPTAVVPLEEQKKNKKEKATKQGKPSPPKPTKSETPVKPIEAVQVEVSKPVKAEPHLKKVEVVTKVKNAVDNETKPEVKANKKIVAPVEPKSSQKVEDVQKPRQHKVSFSEDFKSGDAGSQSEQKSKKKKGRKQQEEHPIIEAVSSADIDDSTIYYLVEMLNQRLQSANGDWATAGTGISKMQYSELQRKYESREVEIQNATSQAKLQTQKIQQLSKALQSSELQKKCEMEKLGEELVRTRKALDDFQNRARSQAEEDKMMISKLQDKLNKVDSSHESLNKMKEENDILKMTIQANASEVTEKNRLVHEVNALQVKLQKSEQRCSEIERQMADSSGTFQQRQAQLEQSYSNRIEKMTSELKVVEGNYGSLESEFHKAQTDLQLKEAESAKLLNQVVMLTEQSDQRAVLESEYGSLAETKQALEDRLAEMDANEQSRADEIARVQSQNNQLKLQVSKLTEQCNHEHEEFSKYKEANKSDNEAHMQQTKEKDEAAIALQNRLDELSEKLKKSQSENEKLDKKNNELRERNWKAMDAVSASEKLARDRIASAKLDLEAATTKIETDLKKSLLGSFPAVTAEGKNFETWLASFLKQASQSVVVTEIVENEGKVKELEEKLSELKGNSQNADKYKSQVGALEHSLAAALTRNKEIEGDLTKKEGEINDWKTEVEKYKEIVKTTEGILDQLQSSVEKEEMEKEEQSLERENEKKKEAAEIKKQLVDSNKKLKEMREMLESAQRERDELKTKVAETQSQLNTSVQKCEELETSLACENGKAVDAPELCDVASGTDSRDTSSPIPVLHKDVEINRADLAEDDHGFLIIEPESGPRNEDQSPDGTVQENGHVDEIAKLKERLEKEKNLSKNLGVAAGKLQTVLKQTQEQLGKEREKNKDLTKKLKDGSSSSSSSSSESDLD